MTLAIRWAETRRYLVASDSVEEDAQRLLTKLYTHWPVRTKTPHTLSHLWATMCARQVLKKVAA
jgi:hypothetical protein